MYPIRCFTCGKVIGNVWDKYNELIEIQSVEKTLDDLKLNRICCRRMIITHVNLIDDLIKYNKQKNVLKKQKKEKKDE